MLKIETDNETNTNETTNETNTNYYFGELLNVNMLTIKSINTFFDISIEYNTLVICDIDETLLYFPGIDNIWWLNKLNEHYFQTNDHNLAHSLTNKSWAEYAINTKPQMTDLWGFNCMLCKINETRSKIVFLTARNWSFETKFFTKKNLYDVGLNPKKYAIYYSHYVPKDEYIRNIMNINLNLYNKVIFIDDNDINLTNVNKTLGHKIECFKFCKNRLSQL